jgi:tetratricopeptide (TPR) repeat protein
VGVEIKPGTVRQARLEAGLSLGDVAAGVVSRTAIYFVETGKAKPSIETLRLIADRTGRPLDHFLAQPGTVEDRSTEITSEVERLMSLGDNDEAVKVGHALLDSTRDPETAAQLKQLLALAHLRLARPSEGRALAAEARVYFETKGDFLMTAECLGHEASAAYLAEDPVAMSLARRALDLCRSLKPVPKLTESRLLFVVGSVHLTNRDWVSAADFYEQALAAGGVVQDLRRLSLIYGGLSMAYTELGQLNQAAHYARRALTLYENLHDDLNLARAENNLGLLLIKRGELAEAEAHLIRSLSMFEQMHVEIGRAHNLLSLCELARARANLRSAQRFADEALEVATAQGELATVAEAHTWIGHLVAEAGGDSSRVDREFATAWGILDSLGAHDRLSRCHAQYAEILERRGDLAGANHHLRLALANLRPAQTVSAASHRAEIASA